MVMLMLMATLMLITSSLASSLLVAAPASRGANKTEREPFDEIYLGVLVQAKNEGMVISEFIEHYLWQGADKIFLIDNDSTDDMRDKLQPFIASGQVEYYYRPERHNQKNHYNDVYRTIKHECKWLIVCDADEYIYNRTSGSTIRSYVESLSYSDVAVVMLQWKMFGSSGFEYQPQSIRTSFVHRKKDIHPETKAIVNTSLVWNLDLHGSEHDDSRQSIQSPTELALNHYVIMSKEYFGNIKMTRGDAAWAGTESVRDWKYFADYDHNEERDDELANLVYSAYM
jgi:glycosyltransferase involved in cell wall biosynthesis